MSHSQRPVGLFASRGPRMSAGLLLALAGLSPACQPSASGLGDPSPAASPGGPGGSAADPVQQQEAGAPGDEPSEERYLHLLIRVSRDGEAEVSGASEVPGRVVLSDYPAGPFLIEVRRSGRIVAVESIPDPFEVRGFGGPPGTSEELHSASRQAAATVAVKVPGAGLDDDLDQLAVTFFRRLDPGEPLDRIDARVQEELLAAGRLEEIASLGAPELASQIRAKSASAESPGNRPPAAEG